YLVEQARSLPRDIRLDVGEHTTRSHLTVRVVRISIEQQDTPGEVSERPRAAHSRERRQPLALIQVHDSDDSATALLRKPIKRRQRPTNGLVLVGVDIAWEMCDQRIHDE